MPTLLLITLVLCLAASVLHAQGRKVSLSYPSIELGALGAIWGSLHWGSMWTGCSVLRLSS